jgi:hypothetical protein
MDSRIVAYLHDLGASAAYLPLQLCDVALDAVSLDQSPGLEL